MDLGSAMAVSIFIALFFVALLHATVGQQVPKLVAVHRAEWITAHLAVPPLHALTWVLTPITWPLNFVVRGVVRMFGVRSTGFHPAHPDAGGAAAAGDGAGRGHAGETWRTTSARCCAASSRSARPSSAR